MILCRDINVAIAGQVPDKAIAQTAAEPWDGDISAMAVAIELRVGKDFGVVILVDRASAVLAQPSIRRRRLGQHLRHEEKEKKVLSSFWTLLTRKCAPQVHDLGTVR